MRLEQNEIFSVMPFFCILKGYCENKRFGMLNWLV